LKRIVSINHRTAAAKVTAEHILIMKTLFPQKKQPERVSQIQQPR